MRHEIVMPQMGESITTGTITKWHKNVGDAVKEGDIIAEIETDKAVQDFESEFDGVLLYQGVEEGGASPVDTILAIIGPAGTDVSSLISGGGKKSENASPKVNSSEPKQEKSAEVETKKVATTNDSGRIAISPLAKKMAEERGIEISSLQGSGENGRIVRKDIEEFKGAAKAESPKAENSAKEVSAKPAAVQMPTNFVAGETTETPNSQVRNIIAKRLSESKFTAPH